jgi:hypothetical protein
MIFSICAVMACLACSSACYWVRRRRRAQRRVLNSQRPYGGKTFAADEEQDDGDDREPPSAPVRVRRLPALAIPADDDAARRLRLLHTLGGVDGLPSIAEDDDAGVPCGVQRSAHFSGQHARGRLPALMVPSADDVMRLSALASLVDILQPAPWPIPPPPLRAVQTAHARSTQSSHWQPVRMPALLVPSADELSRHAAINAGVRDADEASGEEPAAAPPRLPALMLPSGDAHARHDAFLQSTPRGAATAAALPQTPVVSIIVSPDDEPQEARVSGRLRIRAAIAAVFKTRNNDLYEDLQVDEESSQTSLLQDDEDSSAMEPPTLSLQTHRLANRH